MGIGNDLFDNASSIKRILGPNTEAFHYYDKIIQAVNQFPKSTLILLALGPTATIMAYDLARQGYQAIDLAIVPGMAFDPQGHRLGRGRGYYDRFLPLIPQAYKIGLCFPFQLVGNVPTEPTDIAMDEVVC